MAAVQINGRKVMNHLTIKIDATRLQRQAFGTGNWRLHVARVLLRCVSVILRCGVEINA